MKSILHIITLISLTSLLTISCDSADPSFVVSDADAVDGVTKKSESGDAVADGAANRPNAASSGDSLADKKSRLPLEIYKDNGKGLSKDGSVPPTLLDKNTGNLDAEKLVNEYSSSFSPNEIADGNLSVDLDALKQETTIALRKTAETKSVQDTQVNRRQIADTGDQGYDPSLATQSFSQTKSGLLDLLIVIDDSGSMNVEQALVAANLPALLSSIADSDWRITVVTTYDGTHRGTISKGDTDAAQNFANAINVGASGRGNEKGIQYAKEGLQITLADGQPWLRADSSVAVLIISDEDNCSNNGSGCQGQAWGTTDYLTDYLTAIRPDAANAAKVYGLIWHPDTPQAQCSTGYNQGIQYASVIDATGGAWGSICSSDYSAVLSGISQNIGDQLLTQFSLDHEPLSGTLSVTVLDADQNPISPAYMLNDNTLTFTEAPPYGSSIQVSYSYGGKAVTDTFNLSARPAEETLTVSVETLLPDGTKSTSVAASSSFDVLEQSGQYAIKFKDGFVPAKKAKVLMNYREYMALKNELSLTCNYMLKAGSFSATVAGNALASNQFTVDLNAKTMTFLAAPGDAKSFAAQYSCYKKVLSYDFVSSDAASDLYVYNKASKEEVPFVKVDNVVTFPEEVWSDGSEIVIRNAQKLNMSLESGLNMTHAALPQSVTAVLGSTNCSESEITVSGTMLNLSACGFERMEGVITVSYKYVSQTHLLFALNEEVLSAAQDTRVFKVVVDGAVVTDYKIDGHKIVFAEGTISKSAKKITITMTLMTRDQ